MKKLWISCLCVALTLTGMLTGCGNQTDNENNTTEVVTEADTAKEETESEKSELEDGVYTVDFTTDSSMFHVNETKDGKAELTVKDGQMTVHIVLTSKNIVNLYPGLAEEAQKDDAVLLQPTVESVTYSDGTTEDVNAFDVPVPVLDKEFDLALIGTKQKWYDHKVTVSNPVKAE